MLLLKISLKIFSPFSGLFWDPNPEQFIGHSSDINQSIANSYPTQNQFCSSTQRRFDNTIQSLLILSLDPLIPEIFKFSFGYM
jgi:hypothetical protein